MKKRIYKDDKMKNLFYIIFTISYLIQSPVWGSSSHGDPPWDDSAVARIAVALRNKPTELNAFLTQVAAAKETTGLPSYALNPVIADEQIRLSATDIITQSPDSLNLTKVFYVNLRSFDFSNDANRQKVFEYFDANTLANLRYLDVKETHGISIFIEKLFGNDKPTDKFVSLFRINAENSDLVPQDLDKIFNHFSSNTCFILDMKQISSRYDVVAAFLSVEIGGVENLSNIVPWEKGRKTNFSQYELFYRSKEETVKGPFIMSVKT